MPKAPMDQEEADEDDLSEVGVEDADSGQRPTSVALMRVLSKKMMQATMDFGSAHTSPRDSIDGGAGRLSRESLLQDAINEMTTNTTIQAAGAPRLRKDTNDELDLVKDSDEGSLGAFGMEDKEAGLEEGESDILQEEESYLYPLNTQVALGVFFRKGQEDQGKVYYGQHCLAFAICQGNEHIVKQLIKAKARLDVVDDRGNSIIHLCVLYRRMKLYDMLWKFAEKEAENNFPNHPNVVYEEDGVDDDGNPVFKKGEKRGFLAHKINWKPDEPLKNVEVCTTWKTWCQTHRNMKELTALQAAIYYDQRPIFKHILNSQRKQGWRWGPLAMYQYPLVEIDTHGLDNPNSVLEVLVSQGRASFMEIEVIHDIYDEKWRSYGRIYFYFMLIRHITWLSCLQYYTHDINFRIYDEPCPLGQSCRFGWSDSSSGAQFCVIYTFLLSLLDVYTEIDEFYNLYKEHGRKAALIIYFESRTNDDSLIDAVQDKRKTKRRQVSVTGVYKVLGWISHFLAIFGTVFIFVGGRTACRITFVSYSFNLILGWLQLLPFFQIVPSWARFVITVFQILSMDVTRWLVVYLVFLVGFSASFSLVRRPDDDADSPLFDAIFVLFETSVGFGEFANIEPTFYEESTQRTMGYLIYVLFVIFSVVLLLNLLIAIMAETTQSITENAKTLHMEQWASTVLLIERRVPAFLYRRTGLPFAPKQEEDVVKKLSCRAKLAEWFKFIFCNECKDAEAEKLYYVTNTEKVEEEAGNLT